MNAPRAAAPLVLVVDDEPTVLRFMQRTLAAAGYRAEAAAGALQALELAAELSLPLSAVVTDLRMNPIDGPDFARLLAEIYPGTPVLFVTGYLEEFEHRRVTGPVLQKPFSSDQLLTALQQLLTAQPPVTH
ncbi:MAG TPA: response regulator [Gemmatimonadales bacterium]